MSMMVKPIALPGRLEKITPSNAYIMDNGEYINLYITSTISE